MPAARHESEQQSEQQTTNRLVLRRLRSSKSVVFQASVLGRDRSQTLKNPRRSRGS
ncbi:hypothetical protein [Prochlorococcus sp. MIT 1201]|uniref:hypothetical protein n=1 Tax=Prochlorococcus sp. MIT 1201 TaxID=3082535 RepID=UPI0039A5FE41